MIKAVKKQLMNMQEYLKNRAAFPLEELAKHRGEWVAWSLDGTRLVAASRDPDALDDLIRAAGETHPKWSARP